MAFVRSLVLFTITHLTDQYTLRHLSNTEIFLAEAILVYGLDRPSLRRVQNNNKQKKEPLVHNGESRPLFFPSSRYVVVKTTFLGNFRSILILEHVVSGIKITFTKSSVTPVKGKFPKQVT